MSMETIDCIILPTVLVVTICFVFVLWLLTAVGIVGIGRKRRRLILSWLRSVGLLRSHRKPKPSSPHSRPTPILLRDYVQATSNR